MAQYQADKGNRRHAGLLAHRPDGAALCFLEFCHAGAEHFGAHIHPDITLDYIALGHSMDAWDSGDYGVLDCTPVQSQTRPRLKPPQRQIVLYKPLQ